MFGGFFLLLGLIFAISFFASRKKKKNREKNKDSEKDKYIDDNIKIPYFNQNPNAPESNLHLYEKK